MDSDDRTGKLIIITRKENKETLWFFLEELDAPVKMKTTSKLFKLQHAESKDIQGILDEVIKNQQRIKQQIKGKTLRFEPRILHPANLLRLFQQEPKLPLKTLFHLIQDPMGLMNLVIL